MVRTTLNIEEAAIVSAMEMAHGKTKTQVINEALREYARRRRLRGLLKFQGKIQWEGNLDRLRERVKSHR